MKKQEATAINMAKFIKAQLLILLEKLNELDLDERANECEQLHDLAEQLHRHLREQLEPES
ncbi:Rop family plasmid primer RNA-binding protein (plasmid) [Edwardsiella ictaluri]|uniref:Putative RNA one modulator protein n=1 Tax=Edwardsiella ictaluri TaxID=67780 RepID=Q9KI27_EDWIC|nr:Rop family plasmid primer RNA-binding protein [Edwardsiella ictaluri]ELI4024104.1 Rop family plasmid primer RNA-binding protein [Staphylococcus pseudintermedius]AAF85958.1 putative RNA one modulator protein [Edwardsiella ictaluri]AGE98126.1 putative RNA one modulator protein [Edwardsiella ictaluri]AGE98129.1 putative RNA one modulator protein [Edwardsiella ictaluri]AGE98133.1 putative RNA one modulator protein [Edwardsiella ictaluri]